MEERERDEGVDGPQTALMKERSSGARRGPNQTQNLPCTSVLLGDAPASSSAWTSICRSALVMLAAGRRAICYYTEEEEEEEIEI